MSLLTNPIDDPTKKVNLRASIFEATEKKLEAYVAAYEERWGACDKGLIVDALINLAIDKDREFKKSRRKKRTLKTENPTDEK